MPAKKSAKQTEDPKAFSQNNARGRPSKRNLVLDAAVDEFLERGYASGTLEEIARRAGVSTATVFKHYRTKADLFGALMARVFDANIADGRNPPPQLSPDDPEAALLYFGRDYARTIRNPRIRSLFRVIIAEVPRFPELGEELYLRGKKPYLDRLENYLAAAARKKTLRIPARLRPIVVRQFLGMINDIVFWPHLLVAKLPDPDAEAERVVREAVATILSRFET